MKVAVVDCEATSTDARCAEVLEVAAALVAVDYRGDEEGSPTVLFDEELGRFESLNEPRRPIPQDVVDLTCITLDLVRGHRIDVGALTAFLRQADLVVAHNAVYDRMLLEGLGVPAMRWACSMSQVDWRLQLVGRSLPALAREFRLPYTQTHRAAADVATLIYLLGCSSRWDHRRTHPTFLAELLDNAAAEWGVVTCIPAGCYDAIHALGDFRWSKPRQLLYRASRRDRARSDLWGQLVLAYGSEGKAKRNVSFESCDITMDFERILGLQQREVAA